MLCNLFCIVSLVGLSYQICGAIGSSGVAGQGKTSLARSTLPTLVQLVQPGQLASVFDVITVDASNAMEPVSGATADSGMTYLEFYADDSCDGPVTFTSGYSAGICLPASDYVRPPLSEDDHYPNTQPFQSLMIKDVTGMCIFIDSLFR